MQKPSNVIKPLSYGLVLFTMLGITVAQATLSSIGLDGNYVFLFSLAALIALMLLNKNPLVITIVVVGVIAFNLPEATLESFRLDRDILLAFVGAIIFAPTVYGMLAD